MATILKSAKDAVRYFSKLTAKYPDGVLVIGPAGSGKSTLVKALQEHSSMFAVEADKFGHSVKTPEGEKWFIDWEKVPPKFQVLAGISDNIEDFEKTFSVDKRAVALLDVAPERWIRTMKQRGEQEDNPWSAKFKEFGSYTPSAAKKELGRQIVDFRSRVPYFGDRVFTIRTNDWPGYETSTGRANMEDKTYVNGVSVKKQQKGGES